VVVADYVVSWRDSPIAVGLAARPEWWVYVLSAGAWTGLGVITLDSGSPAHAGHHGSGAPTSEASIAPGASLLLMLAATMLPLVAPAVRYVARATLWRRRHRMAVYYVAGFGAAWTAFGLVIFGAQTALHVPGDHAGLVVAGAAALAAVWQGSGSRRRALDRCGNRPGLRLRGWRASCQAVWAGGRHGGRCITTCGPSMLVMTLTHSLLTMAAIFGLHLYERRAGPNPFAEQRWQAPAAGYAVIAAAAAFSAILA
jgi:predicted metal-binding membrane protein